MHLYYSFHGLVILLVAMLGGYPFAMAIKLNNGKEVAWRVVHSGGSVAGVTLIGIGVVVEQYSISGNASDVLYYLLISGTYLLVIAMIIAAITGARGLDRNQTQARNWNLLVYSMYGVGGLLSLMAMFYLIYNCTVHLFQFDLRG